MYLKVNNIRLFYEVCGRGEAVILVHGNGESHKIFIDTINSLSQKYTVYALDMRGQGDSDKITELHYEDMAGDIIEFISLLNIENPYYFGFSDGGIVGLIASLKRPNIFRKMVIAGANTCPRAIKSHWMLLFKLMYFFSRNKMLKVMFNEPNISANQLRQISVKTTVLMGQKDCVMADNGKFIAGNLENGELVVLAKENHMSYVLDNNKLTMLLEKYLFN